MWCGGRWPRTSDGVHDDCRVFAADVVDSLYAFPVAFYCTGYDVMESAEGDPIVLVRACGELNTPPIAECETEAFAPRGDNDLVQQIAPIEEGIVERLADVLGDVPTYALRVVDKANVGDHAVTRDAVPYAG